LPQHHGQDAAVAQVLDLNGAVQARPDLEVQLLTVLRLSHHCQQLARPQR
jgi:hypothetical protein